MGSNIWRFDCRFVAATSGVLAGKTIAGPWTKLHLMLKLLYLIFAVLYWHQEAQISIQLHKLSLNAAETPDTHTFFLFISKLDWKFYSEPEAFAGTNLTETLLTQCLSSVGVLNPSPLKTWPKCPPHAAHVISVLLPSGSGWKCVF